ncbi:hypothetical protein L602_000500000310 [Cupriavidus gilardii J11]|uniref:Uncharacterized protein n=1 Tax=Cupriavidus gilardii J11 TaxID=936133 RepID=A0A562B584_9BURK|nr:hypothetical protein [Cupriavidus gilardii]TWG80385.1 hypothetical protein L602_000500000310 [Cupriavidus gilardii J11]
MPATYPARSICLEVAFFGDERDEVRLACDAVTIQPGAIVVRGVDARHLGAIEWAPDALSFSAYDRHHRFPVGRPTLIDHGSALFPLL